MWGGGLIHIIIIRLAAVFITHPQFYVFVLHVIEELEKVWNSVAVLTELE